MTEGNEPADGRAGAAGDGDAPLVLIAGAGIAGLEALLALHALAGDRVRIALLAPESAFVYRPLSVGEPFDLEHAVKLELWKIAEAHGARHVADALVSVDPERRVVHTRAGAELGYDALLVAVGAVPHEAVPGALTFRGPRDVLAFRFLLDDLKRGVVRRLAFAAPTGATWPLPLYELALMTAAHLEEEHVHGVELSLVTPEQAPLELFGRRASDAVRRLLELRGIALHLGSSPLALAGDQLALEPQATLEVDRVIALPRLEGARIAGLPHDGDGFIPTDDYGAVAGLERVYAAGDGIAFPVKQGGLATQQADAAVSAIAAWAGAPVEPTPFSTELRGLLLTGVSPLHMEGRLVNGRTRRSTAATHALWWPPTKVAGRYLGPYLRDELGVGVPDEVEPEPAGGGETDVEEGAVLGLALELADADAQDGAYSEALAWLDAAERLGHGLPPEWLAKRERWAQSKNGGPRIEPSHAPVLPPRN